MPTDAGMTSRPQTLAADSPIYKVAVDGKELLDIKMHGKLNNSDTDGNGEGTHPWAMLFEKHKEQGGQVDAVQGKSMVDLLAQSNQACVKDIGHTPSTTISTITAPTTTTPSQQTEMGAFIDIALEGITTQNLFEGLDDLADDIDPPKDTLADLVKTLGTDPSSSAGEDTIDDNGLEDMTPEEVDELVNAHGGFSTARKPKVDTIPRIAMSPASTAHSSVSCPSNSSDEKVPELPDMDDTEAMRIIGQCGGFAKPSIKPATTAAVAEKKTSEPVVPEMPDMSDAEAMQIISQRGGFSKPSVKLDKTPKGKETAATTGTNDPEMPDMDGEEARQLISQHGGFSKPQKSLPNNIRAPQQSVTSKSDLTDTTLPWTPTQSRVTPAQRSAESAPIAASPTSFPSRKEVMSARRALMSDGRSPTATLSSSLKTPTRRLTFKSPKSRLPPPQPALTPKTPETPNSALRQLSFKSASMKRPASRLPFNSPSKRIARDRSVSASSDLQRLHSPLPHLSHLPRRSNAAQNFTSPQKAAAGAFNHQRKSPPKLPPVTSGTSNSIKGSTGGSAPTAKQAPPPPCVFNIDNPGPRVTLRSIAGQINTGNVQGVPDDVLGMNADTARTYRFTLGFGQGWGWSEARQVLLARGCNPSVVTEDWVQNHFRWCVWNCASYARRFPLQQHAFWSVEGTINRLLYRYEREYVRGERSALKRVLEMDSSSQQLMVLCVASISQKDSVTTMEVTDGWYSISAPADAVLAGAVSKGRLRVGDKIACAGLKLCGITEGAAPFSAKAEGASLPLRANCVRRAPWDARLGFQPSKAMFMSLSAVSEEGGYIGAALDVVIVRSYPVLYMETMPDGKRMVRCEKEEQRMCAKFDGWRTTKALAIADSIKQASRQGSAGSANAAIGPSSDGEELYNFVMNGRADPSDSGQQLTDLQKTTLEQYMLERRTEEESEITRRLDEEQPPRQVRAFFRLRVCDYPAHRHKGSEARQGKQAMITVWGSHSLQPADFPEGSRFVMTGLTVAAAPRQRHPKRRDGWQSADEESQLRLNFNASSHARPLKVDPAVSGQCEYLERGVLCVDELRHVDRGQEVDVQGVVERTVDGTAGQKSAVRVASTDESGQTYSASIEFPHLTFGSMALESGRQITVRNCRYVTYDDYTRTYIIDAGDMAEFVL